MWSQVSAATPPHSKCSVRSGEVDALRALSFSTSGPDSRCCKLRVRLGGESCGGNSGGKPGWKLGTTAQVAGTARDCPVGRQGLRPGSCPARGGRSLQGSPFSPPAPHPPHSWVHVGTPTPEGGLGASLLSLACWEAEHGRLAFPGAREGTGRAEPWGRGR